MGIRPEATLWYGISIPSCCEDQLSEHTDTMAEELDLPHEMDILEHGSHSCWYYGVHTWEHSAYGSARVVVLPDFTGHAERFEPVIKALEAMLPTTATEEERAMLVPALRLGGSYY